MLLCESHKPAASTLSAQGRLEEAFGALPVWLAAENGIFIRPPGDAWITLLQARECYTMSVPCEDQHCPCVLVMICIVFAHLTSTATCLRLSC